MKRSSYLFIGLLVLPFVGIIIYYVAAFTHRPVDSWRTEKIEVAMDSAVVADTVATIEFTDTTTTNTAQP